MTSIVNVTDFVNADTGGDVTLANGAADGRCVVVVSSQFRTPTNLATATFNGGSATSNRRGSADTGSYGTLISYFNDAALPATGGDYTVSVSGGLKSFAVFELSGWDGADPEFIDAYLVGGWTAPFTASFTSSNAGAVLLSSLVHQYMSLNFTNDTAQTVEIADSRNFIVSKEDSENTKTLVFGGNNTGNALYTSVSFNSAPAGSDYTARKGSTATITHTLTADGITTATLDGETVTIGTQSGQDADINFTDTITTSGEYDLVLGDGTNTETFTVQYNVIGISSRNLNKDGSDLASLDNLEIIVATLGGTQLARYTDKVTTPQGDTGTVLVNTGSALDMVNVSFISGDSSYIQKTELEVI